jgi:hypothetical protein
MLIISSQLSLTIRDNLFEVMDGIERNAKGVRELQRVHYGKISQMSNSALLFVLHTDAEHQI